MVTDDLGGNHSPAKTTVKYIAKYEVPGASSDSLTISSAPEMAEGHRPPLQEAGEAIFSSSNSKFGLMSS